MRIHMLINIAAKGPQLLNNYMHLKCTLDMT